MFRVILFLFCIDVPFQPPYLLIPLSGLFILPGYVNRIFIRQDYCARPEQPVVIYPCLAIAKGNLTFIGGKGVQFHSFQMPRAAVNCNSGNMGRKMTCLYAGLCPRTCMPVFVHVNPDDLKTRIILAVLTCIQVLIKWSQPHLFQESIGSLYMSV